MIAWVCVGGRGGSGETRPPTSNKHTDEANKEYRQSAILSCFGVGLMGLSRGWIENRELSEQGELLWILLFTSFYKWCTSTNGKHKTSCFAKLLPLTLFLLRCQQSNNNNSIKINNTIEKKPAHRNVEKLPPSTLWQLIKMSQQLIKKSNNKDNKEPHKQFDDGLLWHFLTSSQLEH